nr:hypothetical protein DRB99_07565 [Clostridium butyricum]
MNFKSNTTLGKVTFYISLFILANIIVSMCLDFLYPFDNPNSRILIIYQYLEYLRPYSNFFIVCFGFLACINFILGIITLFQKNSNKKFSIISLIICTPLALPCIIGAAKIIVIRFGI